MLSGVRHVTAAGGVLVRRARKAPEVALIYRKGVWDLPKGKLDPGETIAECAEREVREELGIKDVLTLSELSTSVHAYPNKVQYAVKTTHWYLMETSARSFKPQASEGIKKAKWIPLDRAVAMLGFETLRSLLHRHRHEIIAAAQRKG